MPYRLLTAGDRWRLSIIAACLTLFALAAPYTGIRVVDPR